TAGAGNSLEPDHLRQYGARRERRLVRVDLPNRARRTGCWRSAVQAAPGLWLGVPSTPKTRLLSPWGRTYSKEDSRSRAVGPPGREATLPPRIAWSAAVRLSIRLRAASAR